MIDRSNLNADKIIEKLQLEPHPEGGYFKEVYRSTDTVFSENSSEYRNSVTDIYFLLKKGDVSRFHKVLHDEIWNFYMGAPLRLIDYSDNCMNEVVLGGENLNFKHTIIANNWQGAESLGEFTLVGCTVAPGFDFKDFSFMTSTDDIETIKTKYPDYLKFL